MGTNPILYNLSLTFYSYFVFHNNKLFLLKYEHLSNNLHLLVHYFKKFESYSRWPLKLKLYQDIKNT